MGLVWETRSAPFPVGDEVNWLRASADIIEVLSSGLDPSDWEAMDRGMRLGSFGNMNPPVGKFMIGLFMNAEARREASLYRWDFNLAIPENRRRGNVPPAWVTRPVKSGIVAYAAITLAMVYLCTLQVTGARWSSLAAPILLFASSNFQYHAIRVYTDIPQLCVMMTSMVAFNHYLSRRDPLAFASAVVLAGLATAVKFSAAPLVFSMVLFAMAVPGSAMRRLLRGFIAGLIPCAVFIAVNPYLYPAPITRSVQVVKNWSQLYAGLSAQPNFAGGVVSSPPHGLSLVLEHTVILPDLNLPAAFGPVQIAVLIAAGAGALWISSRRRLSETLSRKRAITTAGLSLVAAASQAFSGIGFGPGLFAFGTARLITGPIPKQTHRANPLTRYFVLVSWVLMWLISGVMLSLDWNRYYLRGIALTAVVFAAGVAWLSDLWINRPTQTEATLPVEPPPASPS